MIPKKQDIVISDRTEGMVESSASYYQESQLFFYIINAKARGYDLVNEKQDDLALQLSPLTATLGAYFLGTVRRLAYASKQRLRYAPT